MPEYVVYDRARELFSIPIYLLTLKEMYVQSLEQIKKLSSLNF